MTLYFDTETSGLYPGRIIQLAYIMDYGENIVCKNFYFAVDYIEPTAQKVHGISVEKLKDLSRGKTFSEYADEIYDDFLSADIVVAHNFKFDLSFMIAEFNYLDRIFRYNASFDTMKYFTPIMKLKRTSSNAYKYPKLTELMEFAEVYPYDVTKFTMNNFKGAAANAHDARFDTAAMFLACKRFRLSELEGESEG
ncbi:MAG: 3'-5' exonuclease [Clostridia bacterium]|nr:3'-5' exonuclease [Clostridia bacterium]